MSEFPISITNPMDRAWNGMVARLFRPFQLGKWFALGFSAWLAMLMNGIGFPTYNVSDMNTFKAIQTPVLEFWTAYSSLIIPIVGIAISLMVLIGLVLLWVSARGTFMFLKNVVDDQTEVGEHWRAYRHEGNSLCLWVIGYTIVAFLLIAALIFGFIMLLWPFMSHDISGERAFGASMIATMITGGICLMVVVMLIAIVHMFLIDFVAPLMMKHGITTNEAWMLLIGLMKRHPGTFVLYALFRIVLNIGVTILIGLLIVMTCCCFLFLMIIPYINAVVTLPILVFLRLYSIEFLRAFGDDFDVFTTGTLRDVVPPPDTAPGIPSPS